MSSVNPYYNQMNPTQGYIYPQGWSIRQQQPQGWPMGQQNPQTVPPMMPSGSYIPGGPAPAMPTAPATPPPGGQLPVEQSYIENILRMNLGKMATIYMTFENNSEWNAKIFKGVLEAAGRDHIIISEPETGMRYLLQMVNLDYITFDQPLVYNLPFGGGQLSSR